MGRKEVAVALTAFAAAKGLSAQEAKTKVQDPVEKNKTEVTATESQAKDCYVVSPEELSQSTIVVDTNDLQAVLSEKDIKEAEKLLNKVARKYKWDDKEINKWLSQYPDQEHLLLETLANDKSVKTVSYMGVKEKDPSAKCIFIHPNSRHDGVPFTDYLRVANNAKEVLETSGLSSSAKGRMFEIYFRNDKEELGYFGRLTQNDSKHLWVSMSVNPETGKLDGVSTIGKDDEKLATLTYKDGKFVSGEVNGKPIKKGLNHQQMAMKKVLESRRVK